MNYTPLITATMFDGPKADVLLSVNGILGIMVIILAAGLIMRVFAR